MVVVLLPATAFGHKKDINQRSKNTPGFSSVQEGHLGVSFMAVGLFVKQISFAENFMYDIHRRILPPTVIECLA